MTQHLFVAGVPATGKTWLGQWLEEQEGYLRIDAEKDNGIDFDRLGVHTEWNEMFRTGRASLFVEALGRAGKPVVIDWGFTVASLYVVRALQEAGVSIWWIHGDRAHARAAYVKRYLDGSGPHPMYFDPQMDDIEREWPLIASVFDNHIVSGLNHDGSQRRPEDLWAEIARGG